MVKTRIAPSPTGFFHLGTLRTAFLNFLLARANNGIFQLRIDDTDQERNKPEWIDFIYSEMTKFGLKYDETFRQSEKLDRYKQVAEKIGIFKEKRFVIKIEDYEMTILRENGYPTYNFASILDDYDSNMTHIVRGVDHIANLSKQELIFKKIASCEGDKPFPTVIHAGLLFDGNEKLSKRKGNGTTEDYDCSVLALLNWLFRLGWSHPDPNFDKTHKIMTIEEMIAVFNEGKISKTNCKINKEKLEWLKKRC
jgi:glutamyl/glutaminyl-tRNA synthetase